MRKHFLIGFGLGILIFLAVNLLMAHLSSDCGLSAVFGRDVCADDIVRAGWPLQFYEAGGFAYRFHFNILFLVVNIAVGIIFSVIVGWLYSQNKKIVPK
jgi:ABC-type antimicrobial peptide transport system permease subunit